MDTNTTFPRSRRLLKRFDFMRVLKKGKRVTDSQLAFAVIPNTCGHARLGLAIAKRAVPLAKDRNAIKRQVRESFRLNPDLPAVDIVALTRRTIQTSDLKKIRRSAESLLSRVKQKQTLNKTSVNT